MFTKLNWDVTLTWIDGDGRRRHGGKVVQAVTAMQAIDVVRNALNLEPQQIVTVAAKTPNL